MSSSIINLFRLTRAGLVMAQHGVRFVPRGMPVPAPLRLAHVLTWPLRAFSYVTTGRRKRATRLANALTALGPSYIKLGQFLATRPDLIGSDLIEDLAELRDALPPFSMKEARRVVEDSLGGKLEDHFTSFSPPIAAASIAQVHKATVRDRDGTERTVAVKILRPGVERRFKADLESYRFAASAIERFHPPSRRLRPVAVVENLERTTDLEMDLRLEAAAISEMHGNIGQDRTKADGRFRVPGVDWQRTQKRVLTIEWIDGIKVSNREALTAAGHDLEQLGLTVLRSFLRHAMRDGFFHADMHQGNLLIEPDGTVVAVDFGIVGRLGRMERRFLAEILHGLINRDYMRTAQVHFDAGYVPPHHDVAVFAQAMRAIGEPIFGRPAEEISMADLLGQLFAYTDVFDMETRTELILLQKSMVIVEGVARELNPKLNMWTAAEPIAKEWIASNYGIAGRIREAGESATEFGKLVSDVPRLLHQAESATSALAETSRSGFRLHPETIRKLTAEQQRGSVWQSAALWVGAAALVAIAWKMLAG
ncbi:MAG: 2-polyprenylphenol 6-hydroxylase [Hyphomicrobiaceae bacterium]